MCLIPVYISKYATYLFGDNIINNIRNGNYEHDLKRKKYVKKINQMMKCTRSVAKFKKIYHNQQTNQNQDDNFAEKKMKEMVEMYKKNKKANPPAQMKSKSDRMTMKDKYIIQVASVKNVNDENNHFVNNNDNNNDITNKINDPVFTNKVEINYGTEKNDVNKEENGILQRDNKSSNLNQKEKSDSNLISIESHQ